MSRFPNVWVSVWRVSSVDYFLWIWNISNRWLLYHLLNIIRCVLAGQNQIIDVHSSQYETFALFVFPCFLCAFFSVYEYPAIILDNLELETSHCLICHLGVMLFRLGALMWLSYILSGIISRVFESIQLHRRFNC